MADAIQELKLVLSLDTKAYQAGLKGAKTGLLGLSSAQVAFGMAIAQYGMKGMDALVKKYKEYDQVLDKIALQVTNYEKVSRAAIQANTMTVASLRVVGDAAVIYGSRLEMTAGELARLTSVTAQYAEDVGDNANAMASSVAALSKKWAMDEGGAASALASAAQMSGEYFSVLGQQVAEATPFAKALGWEFEELLAQAVLFKKAGGDFGTYISLMEKNFEKFGGNANEANREIKLITNTVRAFKTQQEAVGYLMEQGFSSRAAIELAEALRSYTTPELDSTANALKTVSDNLDDMEEKVKANLNVFDKLNLLLKGIWDIILNPTAIPAFTDSQLMDSLKTAGYSEEEAKKILNNLETYDKLMNDVKMRQQLAPGKIMKFDFAPYEKKSFAPIKSPAPLFTSAAGFGSDYGGSAASMMINDMQRVEEAGKRTAKVLEGGFKASFVGMASVADRASSTVRAELGGTLEGVAATGDAAAGAIEGVVPAVEQLNEESAKTQTTWEKVEGWVDKAVEKLGIDPELLTNNIWTGLARVGKESLEKLGVDVDGLQAKVQDFFVKAKGFGFDINQFWTWMQAGTGQSTEQIWQTTLENMSKATGKFIMDASAMFATGTMDWKALFGGLWRSILAASVTAIAKLVADWINNLALIAKIKAMVESMPGAIAAIAIGALAVGGIAMLAASKANQPAMAEGGLVMGPTRALIGEAGPEVVFPLEKLNQLGIPFGRGGAHASSASGAPIINISINNPVFNGRAAEDNARQIMDSIARQLARKGGQMAGAFS